MRGDTDLLRVDDLRVRYATPEGTVEAVRGIGFVLGREKLGIVGESGSGKSTTGRAILRLLPANATATASRLEFDGVDLLALSEREMRAVRGRRIAMILQDPRYSLNPVLRVGEQMVEALGGVSRRVARERALALLEAVKIRDPERVFAAYPHELSGGMGQRAMIAMMLLPGPDLLLADEPTSALDVTVEARVLSLLDDLVSARGMGLVLISHDLGLVASFCDRVLVLYRGRVVEECAAGRLPAASHPYTRALLAARPRIGEAREELPVLSRDPSWFA